MAHVKAYRHKKTRTGRAFQFIQTYVKASGFWLMVETAGVEPASVGTLPLDLHA